MDTKKNKEVVKLMKTQDKMSAATKEFFRLIEKDYRDGKLSKYDYELFLEDYVQRIENFADFYECDEEAVLNHETLCIINEEGDLGDEDFKLLSQEFLMLDKLRNKMGEFESLLFDANPHYLQAFCAEYEDLVDGYCFLSSLFEKKFNTFVDSKTKNNGVGEIEKISDALKSEDDAKQYHKRVMFYYQTFVEPQMEQALYFKLYADKKFQEIGTLAGELNKHRLKPASIKAARALGMTKKEVVKEVMEVQKILNAYEQSMNYSFVENEILTKSIKNGIKTKEAMAQKKCCEVSRKINSAQNYSAAAPAKWI